MGVFALIPFSCAKTKTKMKTKTNALVCSGDNALTNEPILQCLVVLVRSSQALSRMNKNFCQRVRFCFCPGK